MKQHLLGILFAVAVCFGANLPAQAQNTKDIVDRLNTSLGISLPSQYQTTVKNFVGNNRVLANKNAQTFTEQFIKDQMKTGWGINKQNQLLFVWDAVYDQITGKQLYTGEDGNQTRLNEFEKVMEKAEACGKKYKEGFHAYMKQKSAEADRRSAEADRRSVETLTSSLKNLAWFYNRSQMKDTDPIPQNETKEWKNKGKQVFAWCQEYNLDFKAILRKELGDDKKLHEMLKFYGIE